VRKAGVGPTRILFQLDLRNEWGKGEKKKSRSWGKKVVLERPWAKVGWGGKPGADANWDKTSPNRTVTTGTGYNRLKRQEAKERKKKAVGGRT